MTAASAQPPLVKDSLQSCQNCIKVLINLCSLGETKVYIPGETHIAAQLRKRSFDQGLYALLVHIYTQINDNKQLQDFKTLIDNRFLNLLELTDLEYNY